MLGTVILKGAADVLYQRDKEDVGDKDGDLEKTLDEVPDLSARSE